MPGAHTPAEVLVEWFVTSRPVDPDTGFRAGLRREEEPIATEVWDYRRAWTCERDLVGASPDQTGSYWRRPTTAEATALNLDLTIDEQELLQGITEKRWLIAVTGERSIARRKHAVRLMERPRQTA